MYPGLPWIDTFKEQWIARQGAVSMASTAESITLGSTHLPYTQVETIKISKSDIGKEDGRANIQCRPGTRDSLGQADFLGFGQV